MRSLGLVAAALLASGCIFDRAGRITRAATRLEPSCASVRYDFEEVEPWLWKVNCKAAPVWCRGNDFEDMKCGRTRPLTDRERGEAEKAEERAAAATEARLRREKLRPIAATLLHCPTDQIVFDELTFEPNDPMRRQWAFVTEEAHGCKLSAWCGEEPAPGTGPFCSLPNDFDLAAAQLAVETGCTEKIEPKMQQVFTRRSWSAKGGASFQITWRLGACGKVYTCTVAASTITCKAALEAGP